MRKTKLKVRLREVVDSDLLVFFDNQLDEEALRMTASAPRERSAFLTHWKELLADPDVVVRAVEVDRATCGYVASFMREGLREVSYWISRPLWGRGVASRSLTLLLAVVTERPLHARVLKGHAASLRVLEKCGFSVLREEVFTTKQGKREEEFVLRLSA